MTGQKKIVFLAKLLPVAGLLLILPPLVSISSQNTLLFGIPSIIAYLFAIWVFLIIGAYVLQRKLVSHIPEPGEKNQNGPLKNSPKIKHHD